MPAGSRAASTIDKYLSRANPTEATGTLGWRPKCPTLGKVPSELLKSWIRSWI